MKLAKVIFRFFGQINFFLPPEKREQDFIVQFHDNPTVMNLIESLSAPHTEIGRLELDGKDLPASHLVSDGEHIQVYPVNTDNHKDIIQGKSPSRFVLDVHLGRLSAYLRMLGFDTVYGKSLDDQTLAQISADEDRILLSRDRGLLMRKIVRQGSFIYSTDPFHQFHQVIHRYSLKTQAAPFTRCLKCNGLLNPVEKTEIRHLLLPLTEKHHEEFARCDTCGGIFWKGSHFERMEKIIRAAYAEDEQDKSIT